MHVQMVWRLTTCGFLHATFAFNRMQHSLSSLVALSIILHIIISMFMHVTSPSQWPPKHCLNDGQYKPVTQQRKAWITFISPISISGRSGNVSTASNLNKTNNVRTTFGSVLESCITTEHGVQPTCIIKDDVTCLMG